MKATPSPRAKRALAALVASSAVMLAAALAAGAPASAGQPGTGCSGPYAWPVKPFDQAHPIRGYFADPRTRFDGRRSAKTLLEGSGTFSFHQGVDISAPDGSRVYPVASGTVTFTAGHRVTVDCGNGRSFQYWHIFPSVRVGDHVEVGQTVLGRIQPMREHVHLTHLEDRRAVNPLTRGRLTPYGDETRPEVLSIEARRANAKPAPYGALHGRVAFVVDAVDTPALPVPGRWRGFPVTPAGLTWRIERAGRVVAWGVARWAGGTVATRDRFWQTYARGTHQNWPTFAEHRYRYVPGTYLFELTRAPFDTRRLRDGSYALVVTVKDTAGNRDQARAPFTVDNSRWQEG